MSSIDQTLAFLFPGQGSQTVGMLGALALDFPLVKTVYAEASEALGYDLWTLVQEGPEAQLNLTTHTQPAMLAAGVAVWRVWSQESRVRPGWLAGHSLGEYTALVCSGVLDFGAAVRLVAERGRLMQQAVEPGLGAMAAILGLGDAETVLVCEEASTGTETVVAANFNAPGQVVIAGHQQAVNRAIEGAKSKGAKRAVLLPVSVPSHSPLMQPAAEALKTHLAACHFSQGYAPVIHNVDARSHDTPNDMRQALEKQLHHSVLWVDSVRHMHSQGVTRFIESGPGKVLAGLNKRIVPDAKTETISDTESLRKALELAV